MADVQVQYCKKNWLICTGKFCKNPQMEVDMGNIPFPISNPQNPHMGKYISIKEILPLTVFNIYMHGIFKNPLICYIRSHCCFLFHINGMIFKIGVKLLLVFSHSRNPPTNGKCILRVWISVKPTSGWITWMELHSINVKYKTMMGFNITHQWVFKNPSM